MGRRPSLCGVSVNCCSPCPIRIRRSGRCSIWRALPRGWKAVRVDMPCWTRRSTRPASMTPQVRWRQMATNHDSEARTATRILDLEGLSFERGAHLLVQRALRNLRPGDELGVTGRDPALVVHMDAWCRHAGHRVRRPEPAGTGVRGWVVRGRADLDRWSGAERSGGPQPGEIVAHPPPHWGLAARGALVEPGGPALGFDLAHRDYVQADIAPRLYAHPAAEQWDPAKAVDWDAEVALADEVERAVVQVITYLIGNEP